MRRSQDEFPSMLSLLQQNFVLSTVDFSTPEVVGSDRSIISVIFSLTPALCRGALQEWAVLELQYMFPLL